MRAFGTFVALVALSGTGLIAGCSNSSAPASSGPEPPDVYVAGTVYNANGVPFATYWKNRVATSLGSQVTVGSLIYGSSASAIAVFGGDVYVAGSQGPGIATYWKNGVAYPLSDGSRTA